MSNKSVKKNYLLNVTYEILLLITPLITTPYLSRVLGADGIGTVSYKESIVSYFTMFASLGMAIHGKREISYVQDDRKKRSIVFWETLILEIISTCIVLLAYLIFSFYQKDRSLYLILIFNLLSVLVDTVWFFQGMEEFGKIVLRNMIFKAINIAYIFIFVRSKTDLPVYIFGLSFFLFLSNLSLWLYLPQYIDKPDFKKIKPFRNIGTIISLFIPTIAMKVYTVLDKTMIGVITKSAFENGYYEQALKISKMILTLVTSLGTVMIPRIGYYYGKGNKNRVISYMYKAYRFVWFLGIPLCFGLIGISANFVPWFFGDDFSRVITLLRISSFLIIAIGINNVTGMQYLIPTQKQNQFTLTVCIGAVVNFVLNIFLIRYFQSFGAAFASVAAETTIALVQLFLVRKELSAKRIFISSFPYLLSGVPMLIIILIIQKFLTPSFINTCLLILLGGFLYFSLLFVLKDDFFIDNLRNLFRKINGFIRN